MRLEREGAARGGQIRLGGIVARAPKSAVYVDGVAILGAEKTTRMSTASVVREELESNGLRCHELESLCKEQVFTGIVFARSVEAYVSPTLAWRVRLAMLLVLRRGWDSGDDLHGLNRPLHVDTHPTARVVVGGVSLPRLVGRGWRVGARSMPLWLAAKK